jgi:hypothetical protein
MPISTMSAPPSISAATISAVPPGSGSPAVTKVTSAFSFRAFSAANLSVKRLSVFSPASAYFQK